MNFSVADLTDGLTILLTNSYEADNVTEATVTVSVAQWGQIWGVIAGIIISPWLRRQVPQIFEVF